MIQVLSEIDLNFFASAALVLFFLAFTAIVAQAVLTPKSEIEYQANLPISDGDSHHE